MIPFAGRLFHGVPFSISQFFDRSDYLGGRCFASPILLTRNIINSTTYGHELVFTWPALRVKNIYKNVTILAKTKFTDLLFLTSEIEFAFSNEERQVVWFMELLYFCLQLGIVDSSSLRTASAVEVRLCLFLFSFGFGCLLPKRRAPSDCTGCILF